LLYRDFLRPLYRFPSIRHLSTLSLHDALPICLGIIGANVNRGVVALNHDRAGRIIVQATDERYRRAAGVVNGGGVQVGDFLIEGDRKSTRLNSSHGSRSYAVFCQKKKSKSRQQ